jgi:anti-sigma factor ChrR (cupin superfamily)
MGARRIRGSTVHHAVDTLGHRLASPGTPSDEQDGAQVGELGVQVQDVTGAATAVAFMDQGYTGEQATQAAAAHSIQLEGVKLPAAKHGFVLPPRRWVMGTVSRGRRASDASHGMLHDYKKRWRAFMVSPWLSYCSLASSH